MDERSQYILNDIQEGEIYLLSLTEEQAAFFGWLNEMGMLPSQEYELKAIQDMENITP